MYFAYKATVVTGLNRQGDSEQGESTGECTPQELTHGMTTEYYTQADGHIVPLPDYEVEKVKVAVEKKAVFEKVSGEIEAKKAEENLKDFAYNGDIYVSDKDSIQAAQGEAAVSEPTNSILTLRGTEYEGCWFTKTGFIPYTNAEFLVFATEYFKRGSDNFTTRTAHLMNLQTIYENPDSTVGDILGYDFSNGWAGSIRPKSPLSINNN